MALARAKASGATEALFADTQGRLSEGTGTNVFVVAEGRLMTPALSAGCLAGVTRALVLHLTAAPALAPTPADTIPLPTTLAPPTPAIEADLPFDVLHHADEIFLTSTTRDVQAVVELDGRKVGTGAIGPVTEAVRALFRQRAAATPDPR